MIEYYINMNKVNFVEFIVAVRDLKGLKEISITDNTFVNASPIESITEAYSGSLLPLTDIEAWYSVRSYMIVGDIKAYLDIEELSLNVISTNYL